MIVGRLWQPPRCDFCPEIPLVEVESTIKASGQQVDIGVAHRSFHALFFRHENVFRQSHRSAAQVVGH